MSSARGASLRVILTSIGSRGDVQPMLAIAQALVARGHRPLVAAPPDFGAWVRGLGFEFAPLGIDVNAFMQEHRDTLGGNIARFFRLARRMFDEQLPAQLDALVALGDGADAIVFAAGSAMAPSAGEKLGVPVLGVLFTTCVLPSRDHAPVVVPWRSLPKWVNRMLWLATGPMWNLLLRHGINAGRARHGLAPVRDVVTHLFEESRYVIGVDGEVLPPDPAWRDRIPCVGFLHLEPAADALDPELERWLAEDEPPVYVGFGSMTGRGPERMRGVMVEAIEATGRRGLVSRGWAGLGGELPRGWRAIGEVPHALLFPRMACVVHHGGAGTTAEALRAGVPQVLVPLILDQYHHAQRLFEEGLAPRPVPMERMRAPRLRAAILEAMASTAPRRAAVAERLQRADAAGEVARRIASMVPAEEVP